MKIRNPTVRRAGAAFATVALRNWMRTARYERFLPQPGLDPSAPDCRAHYVYAFWHEKMLLPAVKFGRRDIHVLISTHRDGQFITDIIHRFGFSTVRGSTTRDALRALRGLLKAGRGSHLALTPDGPRGPRRVAQPGVVYVASRSGLPVVAVGIGYDRCWQMRSWDRFAVPKPFCRARLVFAPPISVPANADVVALGEHLARVQRALDDATLAAEAWAASGAHAPIGAAQLA